MATGMLHTHYLFVVLFTLIYLVKTILLLSDRNELLDKFKKKTKVAEMIVSFGFLATGIYLLTQLPVVTMYHIIKISLVFISIPLAVIGYKKQNKVLASLSFFLIVVSFGLAHKAKDAKAEGKVATISGKEIFEQKCAMCHGSDGKMGQAGAKDLSITQLSHVGIIEIINNGKNSMAAYKGNLSPEQIEAVTNYIETELKAK